MPAPRVRSYQKPKKGTVKRLMKSLWKHFKFEIILSLVTLILSIAVNLCGSIFASLITEVLTKAIPAHTIDPSISITADYFEVNLLNFIPFKTNLTALVIALASIALPFSIISLKSCGKKWYAIVILVINILIYLTAILFFTLLLTNNSNGGSSSSSSSASESIKSAAALLLPLL